MATVDRIAPNAPSAPSPNPASNDGVDRSEYFRQLFIATYDALGATDGHSARFGDDPRIAYGSGDRTPTPIENIANAERGRFGYKPVTLATITAALSTPVGPTPGDAKAALYLAALEALLANPPMKCDKDVCRKYAEWEWPPASCKEDVHEYHFCSDHKKEVDDSDGDPIEWTPIVSRSLSMARAAIGWEKK